MVSIDKYEIFLDFDFKNLIYKGYEKIYLSTDNEVVLDSVGLNIVSVKTEGKSVPFKISDSQIFIQTGKFDGVLEIEFEGKVKERGLVGIYKAPYDHSYIITTQFESVHAREFIPCIDHPAFKARFKLSVKVDKDLDVISNMPIEDVREEGDKKIVTFQETPRMSTYLLYLGIGKFEEIKDKLGEVDIIVATVPGRISKGKFALDVAKKVIEYYEDYFGIKYQLPKEHLIAIPEFAFGAMENWGAITFRETALLADESSSVQQKMRVASVVAHELAHQWFGDLVTMKWWDDLWLNESFATFMSHKAIAELYKEWDFWGTFINSETSGALFRDSLTTTHPIEAHVTSPEEIEQLFDDISYGKGASILRMIEAYLGDEDFRKGIQIYLNTYKYSNATGSDFWNSLEKGSGKPVSEIVKDWITKDGYPVVYVSVNGSKINLEQERFYLKGNGKNAVYKVPLTLEVNGRKITYLLEKEKDSIDIGSDIKSIKVNIDRTGFYRVYYNDLSLVFNSKLSHLDKWGLFNDYFNFFLAGRVNYTTYESIAKQFMKDDNYLVVDELVSELYYLWRVNRDKYKLLYEVLPYQVKRFSKRKDELSRRTYSYLLSTFAFVDEKFASGLAVAFEKYDTLDPNVKEAVAIAYAVTYGEDAYDELLNKYRSEKFDEEKTRLLYGLLSFREPYLVVNTMSLALTGEIKRQDVARILPYASYNPYSRLALWKWLKTHMEFLRSIYAGTAILGRTLRSVIPFLGLNNAEVVEYFTTNRFPEMEVEIKSGLEILDSLRRII
ncbi:M1 family metallopeptidase [Sulfurisphaera tokodaii]|uniref:Probable aminopeptidase 2 n=2 Tax=Sulfurisphaera tokodaii TaxID=111955 RepID=APE2_SULTO|nr:M1 family metallopeptidase [Sulfurisphaera tokodaii]Q974N6.1 RecName: Full=Probable aminopeptidase 2 [Sulfurisphaera tokodaii str. 7]BAB65621.1 probable leucyl aminopeptidase [Sulfurisphaera tokodaii str. 7]HII74675.1 M1 family metallopeptidase [Sulfurisphaera tokodaii]